MRVTLHPEIDHELLERGAEVVLNESLNVVQARPPEGIGEAWAGAAGPWLSLLFFLALAGLFWRLTTSRKG